MGPWKHFLVLSWCVFTLFLVETTEENLSTLDASFCHGVLKVVYPELNISECLIIPKHLRKTISTVWGSPDIYFPAAHEENVYVLMMVDPDAPRRSNSTSAYWRHWLVADIQGASLRKGQIKGTTLTDYRPPTPPGKSGFHRYQIMLFEQPADTRVTLTEEEEAHRGKWDVDAFLKRVGLGAPVATIQYLTQNYKD